MDHSRTHTHTHTHTHTFKHTQHVHGVGCELESLLPDVELLLGLWVGCVGHGHLGLRGQVCTGKAWTSHQHNTKL
jgi:hypothetical protein